MAGTKEGGAKAAATMKQRFGANYYHQLGEKGGKAEKRTPSGFAADRERAVWAGRKGGNVTWNGRRASDRY